MERQWKTRTARRVAAVVSAGGVLALLTTGIVGPDRPAAAVGLQSFGSCEELATWSKDALRPLVGPFGLGGPMVMEGDAVAGAAGAESSAAPPPPGSVPDGMSSAVGNGATGTNLQEAGVDEPDVVKTAGGLLVTTVGTQLVVVDVSGAEPVRRGSVEIPALARSGGPGAGPDDVAVPLSPPLAGTAELLLVGDAVVVLGQGWLPTDAPAQEPGLAEPRGAGAPSMAWPAEPGAALTSVTVVDVADPDRPVVDSSTELEGRYVSARESAGAVRVVVSSMPTLSWQVPTHDVDAETATERNRQLLSDADPLAFVPHVLERDGAGEVTSRRPLMACSAISHPGEPSGAGTMSVVTLDVGSPAPVVDAVGVSTDGDLVYASSDRLYVATTSGGWAWSDARQDGEPVTTALHGFDIGSPSATTYLASGSVEGWLLGRWALSARDGLLRVATTRGEPWSRDPAAAPRTDSAVTVLDEVGDELVPVGAVAGLGVGEQIRAVRWFDAVAVVVTFRQTDPLYVVDLADPTRPTVRGELKVPGYSAYLHPLGDGLLMGVGQDATPQGRTTGAQVATYDLSDPAAPRQVDVLVEPGAWSETEGDSRTFSYLPGRRVALVPMSGPAGAGVRALSVAADGSLAEVGRYSPDGGGLWEAWLLRTVPVDGDRVAAVLQTHQGPALALLALDDLAVTGSAGLT